jgi:hypothetical protein
MFESFKCLFFYGKQQDKFRSVFNNVAELFITPHGPAIEVGSQQTKKSTEYYL